MFQGASMRRDLEQLRKKISSLEKETGQRNVSLLAMLHFLVYK